MALRPRHSKRQEAMPIKGVVYSTAKCEALNDRGESVCADFAEWLHIHTCCNERAIFCHPHQAITEAWEMQQKAKRDGIRCGHCGKQNIEPKWIQI